MPWRRPETLRKALAAAIAVLVTAVHAVDSGSATLPHTVALFTTSEDAGAKCGGARAALDSHKIRSTVIVVPKNGYGGALPVQDPDGAPLYGLLVFCSDRLSYNYTDRGWQSPLNNTQWAQIDNYQTQFHARRVSFAAYPSFGYNATTANGTHPGTALPQQVAWYSDEALKTIGISAQRPSGTQNMKDLYHYPARVTAGPPDVIPIMKFAPLPPDYPEDSVGAVVLTREGREQMLFFFSVAEWSPVSAYIADVWIPWGMRSAEFGPKDLPQTTTPEVAHAVATSANGSSAIETTAGEALLLTVVAALACFALF